MKLYLILLFFAVFCSFARAKSQVSGRVSAKGIDERSKGIDGATVSLLGVKD
jgi:hypothetical protein